MKKRLKVKRVKRSRQERERQQIKVGNVKDDKMIRECQAVIAELYEEARAAGWASGTDVEMAWKELQEGIVWQQCKVCGTLGGEKEKQKE